MWVEEAGGEADHADGAEWGAGRRAYCGRGLRRGRELQDTWLVSSQPGFPAAETTSCLIRPRPCRQRPLQPASGQVLSARGSQV